MAEETNKDKDTGKYIDITNICANKENAEDVNTDDIPNMTKQFTAEEFNGIVRALKQLYSAMDNTQYYINEFSDGDSTTEKKLTIRSGNKAVLQFYYYSKFRKGLMNNPTGREGDIADFTITIKKKNTNDAAEILYDSKDSKGDGSNVNSPIVHGAMFELDLTEYFTNKGGNYEIVVKGTNVTEDYPTESDSVKVTKEFFFYYHVTVTDMYVDFPEDETWWATPKVYKEGETTMSISLRIGGSGNRRVILTAGGNNGITEKTYTQTVSSGLSSIEIPNIELPKGEKILVLTAKMQSVDDEKVETESVKRECMVIRSTTSTPIKLMAVNNLEENIKGGLSRKLFSYAVYDSEAKEGTTQVIFTTEIQTSQKTETIVGKPVTISTGKINSYEYDLGSLTVEANSYKLNISAKDALRGKPMMSPNKRTITVDNITNYSPVANASWYINPIGKINTDPSSREVFENKMDNKLYTAIWNNFSFPTPDETGNVSNGWGSQELTEYGEKYTLSYLRIPTGSSVEVNYKPLLIGTDKVVSIEFDYKISNVSDTSIPAIQIAADNINKTGIKIYPNKISVASESKAETINQQIETDSGSRLRVVITFSRGHVAITGHDTEGNPKRETFNLVKIYINGIVAKVFSLDKSDNLNVDKNLIIGSTGCDIDIYAIRVYPSTLPNEGVLMNYINRLNTAVEKDQVLENNNIYLDIDRKSGVGFENTVDQYNVFVYEGSNWPSILNDSKGDANGILELYSVKNVGDLTKNKHKSFRINKVTAKGQGTSAMEYAEWNIQFKTEKDTTYTELINKDGEWIEGETISKNKIPMFEGVPAANSITMKKNWASSMQDHKAGSVNAFTTIWKMLGFYNAATVEDEDTKTFNDVRVSVYQEPMLGFYRYKNSAGEYVYEYKGLFTGGPHKGDKSCFGYDSDKWPDLISLEGSNNGAAFAKFQVPWKFGDRKRIDYNPSEEFFTYLTSDTPSGSWDYNFGKYDSVEGDKKDLLAMFENSFHKPYSIAYICSQNLNPFNGTLEDLKNAAKNNEVNILYTYWLPDYSLYFVHENKEVEEVDLGDGPINLLDQLGSIKYDYTFNKLGGTREFYQVSEKTVSEAIEESSSDEEKNEVFKKARIIKFRNEAGNWWDIDDSVFHHCWIEFFAGTDQRAKNTYPYSYQTKNDDDSLDYKGLWKWRLDDADTIGAINNSGIVEKPIYVEVHDHLEDGKNYYWQGWDNVFWNLIEKAFEDKCYSIMRRMLDAMSVLGNIDSNTTTERIFEFYNKYFLSIKKYFPEVLYNNDADRYEKSWKDYTGKPSVALQQSLGNAYSAESSWYKKRIDYISSKYSYGDFAAQKGFKARVNGTGTITATVNSVIYPTASKDNDFIYGNVRHYPGDVFNINITGAANLSTFIAGPKYYSSLGDLSHIVFEDSPIAFNSFTSLKELILGNENPDLIGILSTSTECPSNVETIFLKNLVKFTSLSGLSSCTKLRNLDASNTSIALFDLPQGAPLQYLKFPSTVQKIKYLSCRLLEDKNIEYQGLDNIRTIFISDTPGVNSIDLIYNTIKSQNKSNSNVLKYIYVDGIDQTYTGTISAEIVELLKKLVNGEYRGINQTTGMNDDTRKPELIGKISVQYAFEQAEKDLEAFFPGLDITVRTYYIHFEDTNVKKMMMTFMKSLNYLTESNEEITVEDAKKVSSLTTGDSAGIFRGVGITSFNELKYFTNYTVVGSLNNQSTGWNFYGDFQDCTELKEIALDNITTIRANAFENSGLISVEAPKLISIEEKAFASCKNLVQVDFSKSSLRSLKSYVFSGCSALKVCKLPETLTTIDAYAFDGTTSLTELTIPGSCGAIANDVFTNSGLTTIYWNWTNTTPPQLPNNANAVFGTKIQQIYMPKAFIDSIDLYGAWKPYASLLVPYDFK